MDGITLYCIRKELSEYLPLRVQKVYQPKPREVVFSLWGGHRFRSRLLLSIEPSRPFFGLTSESLDNPKNPPGFCLGLRKRLEGGTLAALDQESTDRVLYLRFSGHDDFGDTAPFTLVMDMAGKGANIGLYRDSCLVVSLLPPDGIRFITGHGYSPPMSAKLDMLQDPLPEGFLGTLAATLHSRHETSLKSLSSTVQGLGGDLARSILGSVSVDPESEFSEEAAANTSDALFVLRDHIRSGQLCPALYENPKGDVWVHALPLFHKTPVKTYDTLLQAMEDCRLLSIQRHGQEALMAHGRALYNRVLHKLESRMKAQSNDLEAAKEAQKYRLWAELIDSSGKKFPPGEEELAVLDYYKDPPTMTTVPLDPKYSSGDNARRYYAKYQKMSRAARVLTRSVEALRVNLAKIEGAGRAFSEQEGRGSPSDMRRALATLEKIAADAGIRARSYPKADKVRDVPRPRGSQETPGITGLPHGVRSLKGPLGSGIYVGATAQANDYLATRFKRPGDLWFHAKGVKGAHVLLRPAMVQEAPQEDIVAAARAAAEASDARTSGKVEVDWVDASKVRKPRGGAPGFVTYTDQKTTLVSLHHASPTSDERSESP